MTFSTLTQNSEVDLIIVSLKRKREPQGDEGHTVSLSCFDSLSFNKIAILPLRKTVKKPNKIECHKNNARRSKT